MRKMGHLSCSTCAELGSQLALQRCNPGLQLLQLLHMLVSRSREGLALVHEGCLLHLCLCARSPGLLATGAETQHRWQLTLRAAEQP